MAFCPVCLSFETLDEWRERSRCNFCQDLKSLCPECDEGKLYLSKTWDNDGPKISCTNSCYLENELDDDFLASFYMSKYQLREDRPIEQVCLENLSPKFWKTLHVKDITGDYIKFLTDKHWSTLSEDKLEEWKEFNGDETQEDEVGFSEDEFSGDSLEDSSEDDIVETITMPPIIL